MEVRVKANQESVINMNSPDRLHEVFFYGLYMDPEILQHKGVEPRNPRPAEVKGYELRIGTMATLLRSAGKVAHGMVYSLSHEEINRLYWGAGLDDYKAEAILARINGTDAAVLCCNLLNPPVENESNLEYEEKLVLTMNRLGLPVTF